MRPASMFVWAPTRAAFSPHRPPPRFIAIPHLRPCSHRPAARIWTTVRFWCWRRTRFNPLPDPLTRNGRNSTCNPAPDWFCWIGSVPGAPRAANAGPFTRLQSRNEIVCRRRTNTCLDSLLLDRAHGPLDGSPSPWALQLPGVVVVIGTALADRGRAPFWPRCRVATRYALGSDLIVSASPMRDGVVLRVAGEQVEEVGREIHQSSWFRLGIFGR